MCSINNFNTPSKISSTSLYLPALTGIRAIAAYMVYLHHFNPLYSQRDSKSFLLIIAYFFIENLKIGVTIFFILSGFLITLRYIGSVELSKSWLKNYIVNRIARIYPIYLLITMVTFLVLSYNNDYDFMHQYTLFNMKERLFTFFLNISMLRGFSDNFRFTGIAQGWSLTVEECFYFSSPFILLGISISNRKIVWYPILIISTGVIVTIIGSHINYYGIFSNFNFLFQYTFFGRCIEFFMGIALALFIRSKKSAALSLEKNYLFTLLGGIGIFFYLLILAILHIYNPIIYRYIHLPLDNILLPVLVCIFYFGLIREHNSFTRLLSSSLFGLLGKSSYAFYLIHIGVIQIFLFRNFTRNSFLLFITLNLIAIILFKLVEEPSHQWIKSLVRKSGTHALYKG